MYNINYNINTSTELFTYTAGTLIANDIGSNTITNINVYSISNVSTNLGTLIGNYNNSTLNRIIYYNNLPLLGNNNIESDQIYAYNITDNNIYFINNYSSETILNYFNENSNYTWTLDSNNFRLKNNGVTPINPFRQVLKMKPVSTITTHASGIDGTTIYVNDLNSDYNYYMGQNYTYNTGTLPTLENKGIYTDNNLVNTEIDYNGTNITNDFTGTISLSENQNKMVYYKNYVVNNNGTTSDTSDDYILIELIDNPFTNYPTNMAFNNWITDYSGAKITYDSNYYTRYVKVPVTYNGSSANDIKINIYASWTWAKTGVMGTSWSTAFTNLDTAGMHQLDLTDIITYAPYSMNGYYHQVTIPRYQSYAGYYDEYGNYQSRGTCRTYGGCTYYQLITNENYTVGETYYYLDDNYGYMRELDPTTLPLVIESTTVNALKNGVMAGFFKLTTIPNGSSINNYYNDSGVIQTGTCSTYGGCSLYEMIPYFQADGTTVNTYNANTTYYYLATRDTNIIIMESNVSSTWTSTQNKPFTLTGIYNGTSYRESYYWTVSNISIQAYADMKIENLRIYDRTSKTTGETDPTGSGGTGAFYGRWHNVKIGRGITQYNSTYVNFNYVVGGYNNDTGSSSNLTKYRLIIESGVYNALALSTGYYSSYYGSGYTEYIAAQGIYGSDYDRATNNNNLLNIVYCASGTWGNETYSSSSTGIILDLDVKSGSFGTNKYDYTTGIYVGGRYGGDTYAARRAIIEGGYIYNLIGGPLSDSSMSTYNDSYIYVKGGSVDMITGGAGRSATYGNRIIAVTGGTINYSVFGGSNGVEGSDGDGTLNGTPYVYIGGDAVIGSDTNVTNNNTLSGAEAGSVFGIGNGREGYDSIGSCDNSNVIIDGNATISRNVYGGGNFGATGLNSSSSTNTTNINIHGGIVKGSVYGGGNNNGAGSSSKTATVNINQDNGTINGSLYGGSRSLGTIYGNVNVNVKAGEIKTDVYGGGEGGYSSDTAKGTFVTGNVDVTIGTTTTSPTIVGNVYGGSAFGTVNADSPTASSNSNTVKVTVNNGAINGSVFGGAKGNATYTPHVKGNITVNINGGTIGSVYGGFDQSGTPEGTDYVYLNGGVIGSSFGGGNNTSINTSNIYLQGATTTYLYGGSNQSGDVTKTNVTISSGTVTSAFGGNNIGGTCAETHVTVTGGTIVTDLYGGGNAVATTTTNLNLNSSDNTIPDIYGGGKSADATTTNVNVNGIKATNIFGGSNTSGTVTTSNVIFNSGTVNNVYGGNNAGGTTTTSNVTINNGVIPNVYGGGNQAETNTSHVIINNGNITKVFGGGNLANTTTTYVNVNSGSIGECYGGGNQAGATTTTLTLKSGFIGSVFGGSNQSGNVTTSHINTTSSNANTTGITYSVTTNIYDVTWQSPTYKTVVELDVKITNNTSNTITKYNGSIYVPDSTLYTNYGTTAITETGNIYSFTEANRYYGTNTIAANGTYNFNFSTFSNVASDKVKILYGISATDGTNTYSGNNDLVVGNVYGGNNAGGVTTNTNLNIGNGLMQNVFGGGNQAQVGNTNVQIIGGTMDNVYGGGNAAGVNTNTILNIMGGTINTNAYGGGNEGTVTGDTSVNFNNGTITGSIYAGGNGSTAIVSGNTNITVSGTAVVGYSGCTPPASGSVFGGGNAAATGNSTNNNSKATVNIAGGTIYGNVYGGANTSVVYGTTELNIGAGVPTSSTVIKSDLLINGTLFGGGEANASGSDTYDYSFISVTNGITVNINGLNYNNFTINGSIFGSGDASSTTGTSHINISNYGTYANPKRNVSIQRTNLLVIDNSALLLNGATDRTNEYSNVLFTLSLIDELDLKNNSTLYLKTGSNLLKCFKSLNSDGTLATVTIDDANSTVTKSTDNRLYMLQGKNLNIATNESVTSYGEVYGMTFFGMFSIDSSNEVHTGIYNQSFNYGDTLSWGDVFNNGSYVLGLHKTNHDINADGFYSNFMDEDTTTNKVKVITPTPESSDFYMWIIGEVATTYEVNLTASKYSTLGAVELSLLDFADPNTTFSVLGFDYSNLAQGVSLIDGETIPRIASTTDIADTQMGLTMKSSNTGWLTNGSTNYLTNEANPITGTKTYVGENSASVPTLLFYLYHSKNLGTAGNMGTVTITMMAVHRIDDLNKETKRLVINVNLSRALYNTNDYEAAITAGRQYSMFASTVTNITSKSSISTYFSLYAEGSSIYRTGYHRSLVSSYILPEKTKMTLIDLSGTEPKYYYHTITSTDVTNATTEYNNDSEVSYNLSMFETMGAVNSGVYYDDATMNNEYYHTDTQKTSEEFIIIVDFGDTSISTDSLNNSILMEMRDASDETIISVLGIEHSSMVYNLYSNKDAVIDVNGTASTNRLYVGKSMTVDLKTSYTESKVGNNTVYDTRYFDSKLGIKISLINSSNEVITGTSLLGLYYDIDGIHYTPNIDGTTRIKIADKVGNVETWIGVYTENANIATGQYNLRIESFGSPDGIYYGLTSSDYVDIPVYIVNEIYGLDVKTPDKSLIIDGSTGKNLDNSNNLTYTINYNSGLTNPNIHVKLYRRNYTSEYDTTYTLVDLANYVSSALFTTSVDKEYLVVENPNTTNNMTLIMKSGLPTGTYKVQFILYDGKASIGTIEKYIIIK
jgi:hypothetical protein